MKLSEPRLPQAEAVSPELLPDLGQTMAVVGDWIEDQQCNLAGELCGFDSAYRAGNWLGAGTSAANQWMLDSALVLGHSLDFRWMILRA